MKKVTLVLHLALASWGAMAQPAVQSWVQRYNGSGNGSDTPNAIAMASSGGVFVTGVSSEAESGADYLTIKYSGAGVPLWTNRYQGPSNSSDTARAIVVDKDGNVIVTGSSGVFDGRVDFLTIKYSNAGVALWTNRYVGSDDSIPAAVAVDTNGNVFVAGGLIVGDNSDYLIVSYSSDGLALWTNRYDGIGGSGDWAVAVGVDHGGNALVTGISDRTNAYPRNDDYVTIKYSSTGVGLWTNRFSSPGTGEDHVFAIVVDSDSSAIVTGYSPVGGGYPDTAFTTIKYSREGVPLWTNYYSKPGVTSEDWATSMAIDNDGNVFVTGFSDGGGFNWDYATVGYSSDGVPLWTNRYDASVEDEAQVVACGAGNVYVTGFSASANFSPYKFDYATIAYSTDGLPLWTNRYNGSVNGDDIPTDMVADSKGGVFVTGYSRTAGNRDYATVKYAPLHQPIPLTMRVENAEVILCWTNAAFELQAAPTITSTFTNIPGATSPYTNSITGGQQFFRLISN